MDDIKKEDARIVAAKEAIEYANLLIAAAKRRTDAAMTPSEVGLAIQDTKAADAALVKANSDMGAAEEKIKLEEAATKIAEAKAEAEKSASMQAVKSQEKVAKTEPKTE